jgi:hypothetical protein
MKPIANQSKHLTDVLTQLEDKLKQIEGGSSTNSSSVKTYSDPSLKHRREDSNSGSGATTPRLVQPSNKKEDIKPTSDGAVINGDPHTPPQRRRQLERTPHIKEEQIKRVKKENIEENSSASTTPRSVRFVTSDTPVSTPVSNRSAATTPHATPRAMKDDSPEDSSGNSKPKTPRTKELRKRISKSFSKAGLNIGKLGEKISTAVSASVLQSPKSPKSSGRSSPKNNVSQKDDVLSFLTIKEKNDIAIAVNKFEAELGADLSPARKKMLLHARLMELLPDRSKLTNLSVLDALLDDAKKRYSVALIDKEIDLEELQFLDFVKAAADGAFIKPWDKDSSDLDSDLKKHLEVVRPTFARDFKNSSYEVQSSDGSLKKISTIEEFIEFIGPGSEGNLAMVVSNIASQNLGNFLKNILFLREDDSKISQSILRLDDGTPVIPIALAKAKYIFSKTSDGNIIIDYEWNASQEINGDRELRVKKMTGNLAQSRVEAAKLNIKVRIEVNADGRWYINNPHVVAENWNNVVNE